MSEICIFCQIIAGQTGTELVYQDEQVTAFHDRSPAFPVHILITPNRHITSLNRITPEDECLLGHILIVARRLAEQFGISQDGYRVSTNTGPNAGQTVFHLHFHLMGGRPLSGLRR